MSRTPHGNPPLDKEISGPMSTDVVPEGAVTDDDEISEALDAVWGAGIASDFADSVHEFYLEKGFITRSQYNKLIQIVEG